MQRFRVLATILSALAMVASLAGPAAANSAGVFTAGQAVVGKIATFCNHDGTSDVTGAGLGLPGLTQPKQAFYALRNVAVTVVNDATKTGKTGVSTGTLNACGRLRWVGKLTPPTGPSTAVGAACGMSKGYAGKGRIIFNEGPKAMPPHNVYSLHNINWKATAGGSIPFWASGQQGVIAKGAKGTDLVTGTVNAQGGAACISKSHDPDTGNPRDKDPNNAQHGAVLFTVTGAFDVVNNAWRNPQQPGLGTPDSPGICKQTANPACAYDDKKPQTPKQG